MVSFNHLLSKSAILMYFFQYSKLTLDQKLKVLELFDNNVKPNQIARTISNEIKKFNLLDIIQDIHIGWSLVSPETIINC